MVNLNDFRNCYPEELSGGMKRRVSIARAFAFNGDIMIMDEPFKGLDYELKKGLINDVLDMWNDNEKLLIFVTHDIDEALLLADQIIVLQGLPLSIKDTINIDISKKKRKLESIDLIKYKNMIV